MKLLTKTTLLSLLISLGVFSLGAVLFYKQLKYIMNEETEEMLLLKREQIKSFVAQHKRIPRQEVGNENLNVKRSSGFKRPEFKDTLMFSSTEEEMLPYHQHAFSLKLENSWYRIRVSQSIFEQDDLVETIRNAFVAIAVLFIVLYLTITFLFTRVTWKTFFRTIRRIKNYNAEQDGTLHFEKSSTKEFQDLNLAIEDMTGKIQLEMKNLKMFTENAAHELQTPLAILQSKTENLMQDTSLNENQLAQVNALQQSLSRLKKIVQALLLLTKIENHQFVSRNKVDIRQLLDEKLKSVLELADMKDIAVSSRLEPCAVTLHEDLAEIVLSNLLNNALKYTPPKGEIEVVLTQNQLEIRNTGPALLGSEKDIFKRFHKDQTDSDSTGLGLSIVQSILQEFGHVIEYRYEGGKHVFGIRFK